MADSEGSADSGAKTDSTELNDQNGAEKPNAQPDEPQVTKQSEEKPDPEKERKEMIMAEYKTLALPKFPKSQSKPELLVKDVKKFIYDLKKKTAPDDLDIRITPSNMACRFELPVDLTRLKDEDPLSYLKKYCKVTDSRKSAYEKRYKKYHMELNGLTVADLQKIYREIYQEPNLKEEALHLQRLLNIDLSMKLDDQTFIKVSCFMERIILKSSRMPVGYRKNAFEETNFSALNGKLKGLDISPSMMALLTYIRSK